MITLKNCGGCRNDYYNGPAAFDGKRCWSAKSGRMVTRYAIGTWTLPATPGAFTEVRVPSCYRKNGTHYYEFVPDFVRREDIVRAKRPAKRAS